MKKIASLPAYIVLGCTLLPMMAAHAAIVPDRTRIIFNGNEKSVSITLRNDNQESPYLAQSWVEDSKGQKITSPLTVLPPVQRIEPKETGQVKIQGMPGLASLPQDRESLFYFNVREIPPKGKRPNTLQIALQTRIKLFYRPASLPKMDPHHPWQYALTLTRSGDDYQVNNSTSYYVVLSNASKSHDTPSVAGFNPMVLAPKSGELMHVKASTLGQQPVLVYVDDYGGRMPLYFRCSGTTCSVDQERSSKK